ncbi:hypothetical protein Hypma_001447 [Hypsizygus marmoreus]|uniref:Uncharacterized protein n=1 Tax=Hypsizygus marmoreus TaxID=39966 RepID=A0A369K614_HYPMA|nr:hypothetical protein Hypma_001447 [Hypsizygus marmoreus]
MAVPTNGLNTCLSFERPQPTTQWTSRRDAYRKEKSFQPLAVLRASNDPTDKQSYAAALESERKTLIARLERYTKFTRSWPVDKRPTFHYPAPFSGILFLPNDYYQRNGVTQRRFYEGQDLNMIVDSPLARRCEYLGPSPIVTGFRFDSQSDTALIEWWDSYLDIFWIGDSNWKIEVYFDDAVQGWVSKLRGDYDRNLDLTEYLGLNPGGE